MFEVSLESRYYFMRMATRRVLRSGVFFGLVATALAAFGCRRESTEVRKEFGKQYSCPESQITVVPRADLIPYDVSTPWKKTVSAPPDEVKNDPARLAVWRANQSNANDHSGYNARHDVLEATGCGHRGLYVCSSALQDKYGHVWCSGPY
jgi:hypothetical protein